MPNGTATWMAFAVALAGVVTISPKLTELLRRELLKPLPESVIRLAALPEPGSIELITTGVAGAPLVIANGKGSLVPWLVPTVTLVLPGFNPAGTIASNPCRPAPVTVAGVLPKLTLLPPLFASNSAPLR